MGGAASQTELIKVVATDFGVNERSANFSRAE